MRVAEAQALTRESSNDTAPNQTLAVISAVQTIDTHTHTHAQTHTNAHTYIQAALTQQDSRFGIRTQL